MGRMLAGSLVAALASLALAGAADAAIAPSVSAKLVDEGTTKPGRRTVRVEVSGSCGAGAPAGTVSEVSAQLVGRPRGGETTTYTPDDAAVTRLGGEDPVAGTAGIFRFVITGGLRASALGTVSCTHADTGESGEASSPPTAPLVAPVLLKRWSAPGYAFGGRCRRGRYFQVGLGYDIAWSFGYLDPRALFGARAFSASHLKSFRLHISGGGRRRLSFKPSRAGYRLYGRIVNGFYYIPRKPRKVRLQATVSGLKTNVLTVPVRRRPRGCKPAF